MKSSQATPRRADGLLTASVLLFFVLLATRGVALEDLDAANLQHALSRFDLALHMPHFPGYPVVVAAARAAHRLTGDAVLALQLPGLLAWPAALALLWTAMSRHLGARAAWLAWGLTAAAPLTWLAAGRAGSDALGAALALGSASALALAWPTDHRHADRWLSLAAILAALTIGARASLLPWVLALGVLGMFHRLRWRAIATGSLALAAWTIPFAIAAGPDLAVTAGDFLVGHFSRWGGTAWVHAEQGIGLGERALAWSELLLAHGLGLRGSAGLVLGVALAVAGVKGLRYLPRGPALYLAALVVPYALWIWIGQNPERPRHLLPLVSAAMVVVAVGLTRWPRPLAIAVPIGLLALTLPVAWIQATVPSPPAQLADWLQQHHRPDRVQLFTGQSERVLGALVPGFRTEYASDMDEVERRLGTFHAPPPVLLWTDEIPGSERAPAGYGPPRRLAHLARDPRVNPHHPQIGVWTAEPLAATAQVLP